MSNPRTSTSSRRSSSSVKYAPGMSTPFPTTATATVRFEYPVNSASKAPPSPERSSARERREFAVSLQRALRNLRASFASNKVSKPPPSIVERSRIATSRSSSDVSPVKNSDAVQNYIPLVDTRRGSEYLHCLEFNPRPSYAILISRSSSERS
ncbi:hypothetical protein M408DRAFT_326112 [Serendipita vermifera MAFF 305830]|uniref:Uncharacterized protein n=1 Tax=Serendipita vermifera MAFF 305830 TaxID=933852 RepID=A0A0C2X5H1_SERVB|nr:hypothetical protein M408DRAFT_326112 [Serendipita vermifera MAFF 305830]